jgi:hypothetical protein
MVAMMARGFGYLLLSVLISIGVSTQSMALEQLTIGDGLLACYNWCGAHYPLSNGKVSSSYSACSSQCGAYWCCNGKDATAATCGNAACTGAAEAPALSKLPPGVIVPKKARN